MPPKIFPPSFERDEFSGKSVISHKMAYDLMSRRMWNAPKPGEKAPDFRLWTQNRTQEVSLSELYQTKPVVLILSSWGCDIFRESAVGLVQLHSRFGDDAQFVMVYIREAHSVNGFGGELGRVIDPRTNSERIEAATKFRSQMRLPFLILVDQVTDPVATRWAAWPVRVFFLERDGTVGFAGSQGPWSYRPYRGYQHGPGDANTWDSFYSAGSLEEFLETRFPRIGGEDPPKKVPPVGEAP